MEEAKVKQPEPVLSEQVKEKLDKTKVTFKNLPRLTAKTNTVNTDEDSEEGLTIDNNGGTLNF